MGIKIHTYLPTAGEVNAFIDHPASAVNSVQGTAQRKIVTSTTSRAATLDYLTQICLASEQIGAESILVPISGACEDPIITSSALISRTTTLKFMCALRTGLFTPVAIAQAITTYQRFSGNRLTLNVTPGIPGHLANRYGDWHTKQQLLDQAGEFLTIMKGAWGDEPFDFEGEYYTVKGASVERPEVIPRIFYAGSSEESMRFAAKHADVYMSYVEPLDMLTERLQMMRELTAAEGRDVVPALSFGIIARDTAEEAWAAAKARMAGVDRAMILNAMEVFKANGVTNSGARRRLLSRLSDEDLETGVIGPNLWVGSMLVRHGSAPAFVGSYEEVADRFAELVELGVTEFETGGGTPGVESLYRFGEKMMPALAARGLLDDDLPAPRLATA